MPQRNRSVPDTVARICESSRVEILVPGTLIRVPWPSHHSPRPMSHKCLSSPFAACLRSSATCLRASAACLRSSAALFRYNVHKRTQSTLQDVSWNGIRYQRDVKSPEDVRLTALPNNIRQPGNSYAFWRRGRRGSRRGKRRLRRLGSRRFAMLALSCAFSARSHAPTRSHSEPGRIPAPLCASPPSATPDAQPIFPPTPARQYTRRLSPADPRRILPRLTLTGTLPLFVLPHG